MKISALDGSVIFAGGSIQRSDDREIFLASELGKAAKAKLVSNEWWHLTIAPEVGISAKLLYRGNHLHQVYLLIKMDSDVNNKWTTKLEMQRKALHDEWLTKELGKPPYRYTWGNIVSEFDQKACVSEIILTYAD
jgi:hypothetical protein